jgi:hypothetical protein
MNIKLQNYILYIILVILIIFGILLYKNIGSHNKLSGSNFGYNFY